MRAARRTRAFRTDSRGAGAGGASTLSKRRLTMRRVWRTTRARTRTRKRRRATRMRLLRQARAKKWIRRREGMVRPRPRSRARPRAVSRLSPGPPLRRRRRPRNPHSCVPRGTCMEEPAAVAADTGALATRTAVQQRTQATRVAAAAAAAMLRTAARAATSAATAITTAAEVIASLRPHCRCWRRGRARAWVLRAQWRNRRTTRPPQRLPLLLQRRPRSLGGAKWAA